MIVWAILIPDAKKPPESARVESAATLPDPAPDVANAEAANPPVTYTITQDDHRSGRPRKVEAVLSHRVSESELEKVARAIRDDFNGTPLRTFIGLRVEGQVDRAYWANASFQPDYQASIIGLDAKAYRTLADLDLDSYPTMISSWMQDGSLGHLMVLYKVKNTYKLDRIFPDGGKRTETYLAKSLDGQRLRLQQPDDENGEYYVLLPNGDLEGWSSNGKYAHLPQFKAPPARH
ncbi:zinc ribbon domain-containing protein [Pseudomonas entomophila]|uniref:zinc ribbon domain-containing protein n=1 Tax=Pseudomonas entomophila TaxID=312306 RepID=UPI0015E456D7|nr:zinc ribbon domain-containing protein [Pseudomonas entomophila]MBA1187551.1 zinc ribbon domain-containing protein [Pseudomonas entomophila]